MRHFCYRLAWIGTVVVLASNKYKKGCTRLNTNHPTSSLLESLIGFPTYLCYLDSLNRVWLKKCARWDTATLTYRGSNSIRLDCVPRTFPLGHVPAWKSDLLRVFRIKWGLPLLCQKCIISSQACCRLHNDLSDKWWEPASMSNYFALAFFWFLIKRRHFLKLKWNLFLKKYFK